MKDLKANSEWPHESAIEGGRKRRDKPVTGRTGLVIVTIFKVGIAAKIGRLVSAAALISSAFAATACAQAWGDPVWSDEFNSTETGAAPDAGKWTFDVGGTGWGNHELEIYCAPGSSTPAPCDAKNPNAFQDGHGHLIIRASKVSEEPAPTGTWTSVRLKTLGLKDFQFGRMESCIKLPVGAGLWPAFWMLGTGGKWPAGGEIDIMENIPESGGSGAGLGPTKIESTIHGPSTSKKGKFSLTEIFTFPSGQRVDDSTPACHVYGAIWSPFMVQFYVDDWRKPFFIRTAADVPNGGRWVYNAPFYFLLNLAVGGDWPGPPNSTTGSPAEMVVDYVRVYKVSVGNVPKITVAPMKSQEGRTSGAILHLEAPVETGYVFLKCEMEKAGATCSVDTGNRLNASVVEFSAGSSQTAKISVGSGGSSQANDRSEVATKAQVKVTAFTVSGEQSSVLIPVE